MARIEKNIAKLQANKEEIEQRMADPRLYDGDTSIVVSLQKDLGWISQQILEAEGGMDYNPAGAGGSTGWLGIYSAPRGCSSYLQVHRATKHTKHKKGYLFSEDEMMICSADL